ncbi:MAG: AmmeMemoRadiSam system protein B [bacterium]
MADIKKRLTICFLINVFIIGISFAQATGERAPYAAGRFYEKDPVKLTEDLKELFAQTTRITRQPVLALISPHAGYAYSGVVSATAFKQLPPEKEYENIFIIGSSHTMAINGASIYNLGDFITPLGTVHVNLSLADELIGSERYFQSIPEAHRYEHILENQLPFLQYYLKEDFSILPIVVGTGNDKVITALARALKPYFNERNLFVISADFSHYPGYRDACHADSLTAAAIMSNDEDQFENRVNEIEQMDFPGLSTATCGASAIRLLLKMSETEDDLKFLPLRYMNSGDVAIGDKNRVVGYFALALYRSSPPTDQSFYLDEDDKQDLLTIARFTLDEYIALGEIPDLNPKQFSEALQTFAGAFVTLTKNDKLRGCIGRFNPEQPLYQTVQEMTISAATQDYRFQPVRPSELDLIDLEISVLTPLKKIEDINEIELGKDGIYIVKGNKSGTYLPQVATDTGWTLEEFLGHCARDKAGIGWDGWKNANIYTYQAIVFSEHEFSFQPE